MTDRQARPPVAMPRPRHAIVLENSVGYWFNGPPLNYVAGLDIGSTHVRAVVLGYGTSTPHAPPWIRVLHWASIPIPGGVVSGAVMLDPRAAAGVIVDAMGGPDEVTRFSGMLWMGLPPSTVLIRSIPLAALLERGGPLHAHHVMGRPGYQVGLDRFEARVIAEAEHVMALDRDELCVELCVDWFRTTSPDHVEHATIVATTRAQVEARVRAAALAGLRVTCVDGDAEAAIRACRFWMRRQYPDEGAFLVTRVVAGDARTWCVHDHGVEMVLEGDAALDWRALAMWARARKPRIMVSACDGTAQEHALPDAGDVARYTGCALEHFDVAQCGAGIDPKDLDPDTDSDSRGFAVAFGLALRGVA